MSDMHPAHVPGAPGGLHPDLARIQSEHDQIVDAFDLGHISYDEAAATLAALQVVDGVGALWGITDDGAFVRRPHPDAPPVVANPAVFAAARVPTPGGQQAPWPGVVAPGPGPEPLPRVQRPSRAPREPRAQGRVVELYERHKRMARVVAGCLALLAVVALYRAQGDGSGPGTTLPRVTAPATTAIPETTVPPGTTPSSEPTTTSPTTTPTTSTVTTAPTTTTTTTLAPPPNADKASKVIEVLESGDRAAAAAQVVDPGGAASAAVQAAFFSGLTSAHLVLVPGTSAATAAGASQTWSLKDATSGAEVAVLHANWVRAGTGWKLATWPTVSDPASK